MAALVNDSYVVYTAACYVLYCVIGSIFLIGLLLKFYLTMKSRLFKKNHTMHGKTVLITGADSGMGKATAYDLAKRNARVIMACRNLKKAALVAEDIKKSTENDNVVVKYLDLSSFKSVRSLAQDILETEDHLHVLINNAGIAVNPGPELTDDGYERIMQTNYMGHFLLTLLLLDLLRKSSPGRIINVSSIAYRFATLNRKKLDFKSKGSLTDLQLYSNSNLAGILVARELALRLLEEGVTVNTACLELVNTYLFTYTENIYSRMLSYIAFLFGQTAMEGAQTIIRLAVDSNLETTTGQIFKYCQKTKFSKKADDRILSQKLFQLSEQIVGVSFYDS